MRVFVAGATGVIGVPRSPEQMHWTPACWRFGTFSFLHVDDAAAALALSRLAIKYAPARHGA